MGRKIIKPTISAEQVIFMRENSCKMTQAEMAAEFGCSTTKVAGNALLLGIEFTKPRKAGKNRKDQSESINGFFNVDFYRNWLTGFTYGKNY